MARGEWQYDDETSWEAARRDLRNTATTVAASRQHGKQSKALAAHLAQWDSIDSARRAADDGVVDANARVRWVDYALDTATEGFARELLHAAGGDREALVFRQFFPEPPSEVVRLGLESELAVVARWFTLRSEVKLDKASTERLDAVEAFVAEGREALAGREQAAQQVVRVGLQIARWKEDANGLRRSVASALESYAVEQKLSRDYSDLFFLPSPRTQRKGRVADNEERGGGSGPGGPKGGGGAPT